jgi:hypothetical protein
MVMCRQKFCRNCVKPRLDKNGKFMYGICKVARRLYLYCKPKDVPQVDTQILICIEYENRTKKLNY